MVPPPHSMQTTGLVSGPIYYVAGAEIRFGGAGKTALDGKMVSEGSGSPFWRDRDGDSAAVSQVKTQEV